MYSLTTTATNVFDGSVNPPSHGINRCEKYHVHAVTGTCLVFLYGITGTDENEATHWASIAAGSGVTFEANAGISIVKAKSASTSTLNAFPVCYRTA